jgi:putative colanic acid biosynthesis UDP-glucose lipid carrier transferase
VAEHTILKQASAANSSIIKIMLERGAAAIGLLLLAPLLLIVAAMVRLDSPGPILFRQERRGMGGETFPIYKFRTMSAAASRETFRQAVAGDARVTRLGRFLRATSIDELPQLLNVLKGDMALIGPRPHPLALDEVFCNSVPNYLDRYLVRPGITGLAQVSGHRGPTPDVAAMSARVALDLGYIENWSLKADLIVLFRTIKLLFLVRDGT